ncbi:hypothetical protein U1839_01810 [Sphingomonas sp. RT2P30]
MAADAAGLLSVATTAGRLSDGPRRSTAPERRNMVVRKMSAFWLIANL